MSEPKRYAIRGFSAALVEEDNGVFIRYEDYARLKAECQARQAENSVLAVECDSLKAEVERLRFAEDLLKDENQHLHKEQPLPDGWNSAVAKACDLLAEKEKEIARLKAEVERLRKAGDELAGWFLDYHPSAIAWNAAKEGKQS